MGKILPAYRGYWKKILEKHRLIEELMENLNEDKNSNNNASLKDS